MKTTLQKTVRLHTATAYLTFEREVERLDIQEYLAGKHFNNVLIENRVRAYLRNINLFDEKDQLTAKGHKAKETGKIFVQEEGKYKIWFTEKDTHFGTKIFYFKRIEPRDYGYQPQILDVLFDKESHYFLPVKDATFSQLKLIQNEKILGNRDSGQEKIHFTWEWNELASSNYQFEGKIDKENIQSVPIPTDEKLEYHIARILTDWDNTQKRAKMKHKDVTQVDKKAFETTCNTNWREFEVTIQQLPIMPFNAEEAKIWRNDLLEEEARRFYFSESDFNQLVTETNDKNGFSAYKNKLDTPSRQEYGQTLRNKNKAVQSVAYWHLMAAVDLYPRNNKSFILTSLNYVENARKNFSGIVNELKDNTKHDYTHIFYYDKHVKTDKQQYAVAAFFEGFGNVNKYLITENNAIYLARNKPEIIQKEIKTIFTNHSQHDRYLIIANGIDMTVWQISNSIDYIRFNSIANITPDLMGTIHQSVSFHKVEKQMLKKELLAFIQQSIR